MRIKITVEYDGTDFCGWQTQPAKRSIQGETVKAIKEMTGEDVTLVGSGRTDAGVHAFGQVAHFDICRDLPAYKFISGLNYYLPKTIRIIDAEEVSPDFHARFSAKRKTYVYRMYLAEKEGAIYRNFALNIPPDTDIQAMDDAARLFVGKKDFRSFMASGSDVVNTEREVFAASVAINGDFVEFTVTADGFLYNMVRIMTALLIKVGAKELSLSDVRNIIEAKDRNAAKFLAPAKGLYLSKVVYTR